MAPGQTLHDFLPNSTPPPPPLAGSNSDTSLVQYPLPRPLSPKDREDPSSTPGVCGLLNMGNTCYMNAGLQCLRAIPEIAQYYLRSDVSSNDDVSTSHQTHLTDRFSTLLHKIWSGSFSAVHPNAFKTTLGVIHSQFGDSRQQDCQEFLAMLLGTLHEDCTPSHSHPSQAPPSHPPTSHSSPPERIPMSDKLKCREGKGGGGGRKGGGGGGGRRGGEGGGEGVGGATAAAAVVAAGGGEIDGRGGEEGGGAEGGIKNGKNEARERQGSESVTSIVTDTFQGTLQNEVLCHTCQHLSKKEEPFVYLSVPLPHAYERQIFINWVPVCLKSSTRKIIRVLVTVLKHVSVKEVKTALADLIGQNLNFDLIQLAEVKDNYIVRILLDTLSLKHIDDRSNEIYGFEMSPIATQSNVGGRVPSNTTPPQTPRETVTHRTQTTPESETPPETQATPGAAMLGRKHGKGGDIEPEGHPAKIFKRDDVSVRREDVAPAISNPIKREGASPVINESVAPAPAMDNLNSSNQNGVAIIAEGPISRQAVVVEWHSCGICLEEMVDSELLTHGECGAIVCPTCLRSSVEHYGKEGGTVPCPICSKMVKSEEGFTPLATPTSHDTIKLLQTTILFRAVVDGVTDCVAPPALLHLPSLSPGHDYHTAIRPLLLPSLSSSGSLTLCLTDARGRYCSRCLYNSGCSGCTIANSATPADLKPGDHIAVCVVRGEGSEGEMCEVVEAHPSLREERTDPLSLAECLSAFSQREELGGQNRWFCPTCKDFSSATRVLSVSKLPKTIIIHLKRFIYHSHTGSKVDAPVAFPTELDPKLVSHDCHVTQPLELVAFVCHFGSLNSGHYTAYIKDLVTKEWAYYNDETVTKQQPMQKDVECAYILFYRRKDIPVPILPAPSKQFNDEAEMKAVAQLLRQHKPTPSAVSQSPPQLKRSNSTGDLCPPNTEAITAQTNLLLASLGLDPTSTLTYTVTPPPPPSSASRPQSPPPTFLSSLFPTPHPSRLSAPHSSHLPMSHPTSSILDDYMNYEFSDDSVTNSNVRLLSVRSKEW